VFLNYCFSTLIISTSFTTGIFPIKWKISRITALYKNGNRNSADNYRPVDILSLFNKLIERHVNTKLIEHLTENELLSNFQFRFRKNHSTIDALISIQHKVYQALNSKIKCVFVSLDLCKAFQTVNIDLLQDKLFQIGCDDKCLKWFRSYLGNRYQFVKFKKRLSKIRSLNLGTAQGSILDCLLFAIFVNDIKKTWI
jgi:hypothetical protein